MKKKAIIPIVIVLAIVALIAWRLASNKKAINEKSKPKVQAVVNIPVTVAIATKEMVTAELTRSGTLIPNKEADIMSTIPGQLTSLNIHLGSYVSQGAAVARLDNRQYQISLEQAQIAKAKADRDYTRYQNLVAGDAAPAINLQDAKVQRDNAAKQIDLIKKQISDNIVRSPISGQVVSKLKEPGEYVNAGVPIAHVVDISRLKANVTVNEADAYTLKLGNKVSVTTDIYPGHSFSGTISFISAAGDATHSYPVEVMVQNMKSYPLKAGTTVNVNFNTNNGGYMMTIPRAALTEGSKTPKVYVAENGKAMLKEIVIGREIGEKVEVISGLEEGASVIVSGQINLKNGSAIAIVK